VVFGKSRHCSHCRQAAFGWCGQFGQALLG
jgi:hypothetical protein